METQNQTLPFVLSLVICIIFNVYLAQREKKLFLIYLNQLLLCIIFGWRKSSFPCFKAWLSFLREMEEKRMWWSGWRHYTDGGQQIPPGVAAGTAFSSCTCFFSGTDVIPATPRQPWSLLSVQAPWHLLVYTVLFWSTAAIVSAYWRWPNSPTVGADDAGTQDVWGEGFILQTHPPLTFPYVLPLRKKSPAVIYTDALSMELNRTHCHVTEQKCPLDLNAKTADAGGKVGLWLTFKGWEWCT